MESAEAQSRRYFCGIFCSETEKFEKQGFLQHAFVERQGEVVLFKVKRKEKIFVIGRNKTGTTSIAEVLSTLGFKLGDQLSAELLIEDWARRDFRSLV